MGEFCKCGSRYHRLGKFIRCKSFCQTKISHFQDTSIVYHQIRRFNISMGFQPARVSMAHCSAEFHCPANLVPEWNGMTGEVVLKSTSSFFVWCNKLSGHK